MIELANQHAADADLTNVVFCLGRIEDLPVEDASVDLVISNCAISLSPAKDRVAAEAWGASLPADGWPSPTWPPCAPSHHRCVRCWRPGSA
jgi:hypothetical protein